MSRMTNASSVIVALFMLYMIMCLVYMHYYLNEDDKS